MNAFFLIGERLNTQRERFNSLLTARDAAAINREAARQIKSGATHLDLNTSRGGDELETAEMLWLLETILPELPEPVGLVLDSVRPHCIEQALKILNGRPGTILNTSTAAPDKIGSAARNCISLAAKHDAGVIVMLAHGGEKTTAVFDRMNRAEELRTQMCAAGIPDEKQFFDPQVLPAAFDPELPQLLLKTVRELRRRWPQTHAVAGLSNISFNMPGRSLLNRTFLPMLLSSGIDTILCDPCDKQLRQSLAASRALLGNDDFFADYLSADLSE